MTNQKQKISDLKITKKTLYRYVIRRGVYLKTIWYRRTNCRVDNSHGLRLEYLHLEIEDAIEKAPGRRNVMDCL